MGLQSVLVLILVVCSFIYAAWALLPQAGRRILAQGLLRWPLPRAFARFLQQAARAQAGCNCSGCDRAPANVKMTDKQSPATPASAQPLVFHPRKRS